MLALNGADQLNGPRQWGSLLFCLVIVLSLQRAEGSTEETGSSYTKIRILPCHRLPFDRSSLTHWRQRLGEEQLMALIQESLSVAHKTGALATRDLERVVVTPRCSPKRSRIPLMCGCAIAHWKNWSISRAATTCHCGRAIGRSPSVPQSWSGATRMRTSSSVPGASSSSCAFGWAA